MTRRTPEALAAHHQALAQSHARRAWIESHPEIKEALAIAKKCATLADELDASGVSAALRGAWIDIQRECESVIEAELSRPAPGKAEEKQL